MKKTFSIIFICLSALIILDSLDFSHALMLFLLAGVVPGTNEALSPAQTMQLFALLIGVVLGRMTAQLAIAASRRVAQYSRPKAAILAK